MSVCDYSDAVRCVHVWCLCCLCWVFSFVFLARKQYTTRGFPKISILSTYKDKECQSMTIYDMHEQGGVVFHNIADTYCKVLTASVAYFAYFASCYVSC